MEAAGLRSYVTQSRSNHMGSDEEGDGKPEGRLGFRQFSTGRGRSPAAAARSTVEAYVRRANRFTGHENKRFL